MDLKFIIFLDKQKNEQENATWKKDKESNNGVGGNHPFLYMLGNLMKKMDTKHTDTENSKNVLDCGNREDGKIRMGQSTSVKDQINQLKRKPEDMKQYPQPIETGCGQPIEEEKLRFCEKTGIKLNQNQNSRVSETNTLFEQQPKKLIMTMKPRSNYEYIQSSYERTIEESRAARQSAQNLLYQEHMMEKKRF